MKINTTNDEYRIAIMRAFARGAEYERERVLDGTVEATGSWWTEEPLDEYRRILAAADVDANEEQRVET